MLVNNPIEIYSTVVGAKVYDDFFNILTSFGITFLPILIIVGHAFHRLTSSALDNVTSAVIRSVLCELLIYVVCLMLFVIPSYPVSIENIIYKPHCSTAEPSTFLDTGTTMDDTMSVLVSEGDYDDIRLPPGFIFFLEAVSGITAAAIDGLSCPIDINQAEAQINQTRLTPDLGREISRFQNECFLPAKTNYNSDPDVRKSSEDLEKEYGGIEDISWMGSHTFQELYYPDRYAKAPVEGFSPAAYPGYYAKNNEDAGVFDDEYGTPDCLSWWADSEDGIEARIINLVDNHDTLSASNTHEGGVSVEATIKNWLASLKTFTGLGNQMTSDDVIAYHLLYDMRGSTYQLGLIDYKNSFLHQAGHGLLEENIANPSQRLKALGSQVKQISIDKEIPIYQAVIFSLLLALGPLVLVLGSYRIKVIFTYYFVTSSMIFISFITVFLKFLQDTIVLSMMYTPYFADSDQSVFINLFAKLYFVAPIAFLSILSLCGVKVGGSLKEMASSSESTDGTNLLSAAKVGKMIVK